MTGFPISGQQSDAALVIPQLDDHQSRPLMAKMARIFREIGAMSGVKRFRQSLSLPEDTRRFSQRAFRLYDEYLVYIIGKVQKKGWRVYCGPGCAACCFNMPAGISNWEFLIIYDHIQQTGQLAKFFRRSLESYQVLDRVKRQLVDGGSERQIESKSGYETLLHNYSLAKHGCAFLNDAQECLIYSARPLACRMHFAFTPPELCDSAHHLFSQGVRVNLSPHGEVEDELKRLDGRLNLALSDLLAPGLAALAANIMRFSAITWL
ncbi:MAG: YkgJ family cysteine cluster protein [Syntrophobacteria bacterium]|jgi:Fe-S-cluster containining protein